jgi:lipopolysaccharide/colanic/teichoic acid biosynthesis glycosyltransferase
LRAIDTGYGSRREIRWLEGSVLKRGVDIALSGVLLIVSLPVLAVAAIAIKLDSEGPVFFHQTRMGRNFRRFQIWKLRSMRVSAHGLGYTLGEDPRVTRLGRWLRWLKVDELPQLWNVLRGDMSMVGPRPVVPELALGYWRTYKQLLKVRPGLTDPATLKYCHEEQFLLSVPDPQHYYKTILVPDKLRISAAYLERSNFWSDLGVLGSTAFALIPDHWIPRSLGASIFGRAKSTDLSCQESAQDLGRNPKTKLVLTASEMPIRPDIEGQFTYHLHLFDEQQATGNLFGSLTAGTIYEASERLAAICGDLGADNGELTITGPWYAPDSNAS